MSKRIVLNSLLNSLGKEVEQVKELDTLANQIIFKINESNNEPNEQDINSLFDYLTLESKDTYQTEDTDLEEDEEEEVSFEELLSQIEFDYENPSLKEINLLVSLIKNKLKDEPNLFKSKYNDISRAENTLLKASLETSLYLYAKEYNLKINENLLKENTFLLMSFDFSGIQDFVFDIPHQEALSNLRSRSFYLEMIAEVLSDQILIDLNLSRAHIIYVGGGHGYLLLPNTLTVKNKVLEKVNIFNGFFLKEFNYSIYVSHTILETNALTLMSVDENYQFNNSFGDFMSDVFETISKDKRSKYNIDVLKRLNDTDHTNLRNECYSCGRPLENRFKICLICRQFLTFSEHYTNLNKRFYILLKKPYKNYGHLVMPLNNQEKSYLHAMDKNQYEQLLIHDSDLIIISYVKNLNNYIKDYVIHLSFIDKVVLKEGIKEASIYEIVKSTDNKNLLTVLKLDIDGLGLVFKEGFKKEMYNIARMASLSNKISYYYKEELKQILRMLDLTVIFSGGDDVFLLGKLDDVLKFSKLKYIDFQRYTKGKLHFSGGIGIFPYNYPVYKMSDETEDLLLKAKSTTMKNSITLFSEKYTFSWEELFEIIDGTNPKSEYSIIKTIVELGYIKKEWLIDELFNQIDSLKNKRHYKSVSYQLMYKLANIREINNWRFRENKNEYKIFKEFVEIILKSANIVNEEKRKRLKLAIQIYYYEDSRKRG